MIHTVTEAISASGYAYHTALRPSVIAKMYAAGIITNNCLHIDMIKLYTPFPSAWNIQLEMIQNPANMKLKLIARSAGIPIAIIVSEASKSAKSWAGNIWNTSIPTSIMPTAITILSFNVSKIRFLLRAP